MSNTKCKKESICVFINIVKRGELYKCKEGITGNNTKQTYKNVTMLLKSKKVQTCKKGKKDKNNNGISKNVQQCKKC